ncbi:endonuclease III [Bradyrhizobium sp. GM2.4]
MTIHLETQSDLEEAVHALVKRDPRLKPVLATAGMPALRRREPGFAGLAHIVCGQQLSTASAAAIWGRLSAAFDPFDHEAVRRARTDRLGRLGLSAAKIKTLKHLAREITAERLNLDVLAEEDADAAHHTLIALPGIGPWTPRTSICCSASAMATPGRPATSPCRKASASGSACRRGQRRSRWRRSPNPGAPCAERRHICGGAIIAR